MRLLLAAGVGLAIAATMSLLPVSRALACSCAVISEREAFEGADVVFEGVALSANEPLIIQSSGDPVEYTFSVEKTLKGDLPSQQVTMTTALSGASCGAEFQVGERWRVFAYGSSDNLGSNLCAGNRLLGEASATDEAPTPSATPILLLAIGAVVLMIAGLAFGLMRSLATR
jgi:hypothetical protein